MYWNRLIGEIRESKTRKLLPVLWTKNIPIKIVKNNVYIQISNSENVYILRFYYWVCFNFLDGIRKYEPIQNGCTNKSLFID